MPDPLAPDAAAGNIPITPTTNTTTAHPRAHPVLAQLVLESPVVADHSAASFHVALIPTPTRAHVGRPQLGLRRNAVLL